MTDGAYQDELRSLGAEHVFDNDCCRIFWLPSSQVGFGVWSGLPRPESASEALASAAALLRSHGTTQWVSSTVHALVSPPATQTLVLEWLEAMGNSGRLTHWANLPPVSPTARLVTKQLGAESYDHGVAYREGATLEAVLAWMRRSRPTVRGRTFTPR